MWYNKFDENSTPEGKNTCVMSINLDFHMEQLMLV